MISQTLKTSLLMKQEEILILRENDKNNQIKFLFNDLTGITSAEFRLIKPDDTFVIVTGEIDADDNSITFDVDEQMCVVPGNARFNIRLIGDNMNVYTYVSRCIIDINLDLDNAIESTAEVNGYTFPDDFALKTEIPGTDTFATKSYVNEAIAEVPTYTPPNYSTTEQDTGLKWIDGKTLYEKTFEWSNVKCGNESQSEMIHDLVDVDSAFVYLALYKDTSSSLFSSWSNCTSSIVYGDDAETPLNWQVGANKVYWLGDWANAQPYRHYIVVIRYTKTTDTV